MSHRAQVRVVIAGSTEHTVMCAEALRTSNNFQVSAVITPSPKPIGRKQLITPNPLHNWATMHHIPVFEVTTTLDTAFLQKIERLSRPELLLVVDFGYIIPPTMLEWPSMAPVNIHPSELPRWRGASPGQFVLLAGEENSAVSIIVMSNELDAGPLIAQLPLKVSSAWTSDEYYREAFTLVSAKLPEILQKFSQDPTAAQPQPTQSPTPFARRLTKADSFVEWSVLQKVLRGEVPTAVLGETSTLLHEFAQQSSWSATLERAVRAFSPWPLVWTIVSTDQGEKRMQILRSHLDNDRLILDEVKIEGKTAASWSSIQNSILR